MFREDFLLQDQEITGSEIAVASESADSPDGTSAIAVGPALKTHWEGPFRQTLAFSESPLSSAPSSMGHACNAAADTLTQKSTGDPFDMMTEQQWKPDSRANDILGHYHTLIALLCVNKEIYNEAKPLFYAVHFVFGSMPAFDKFLRKQSLYTSQ
nr:hypothetical protein B0A51_11801 [Rachicladosporium sp. CCFEE 5018]